MAFNRDEVTAEILTESLKKAGLPEEKITPELVDSFKRELQANNIINNKNVLSKDAVKIGAIEFKDETLKEHAAKIKESFTNFMHQKGSHKIPIINKDEQAVENKEWNYVSEESFKKILDNLRNKLMKRSIYRFNLEQGKFIDECAAEINEDLKYKSDTLTYEIAQGSQSVDETRKFDFKMSSVIQRDEKKSLASQAVERSYLEAVDSIMYHTMLPRLAVMKIINGLEKPYMLKSQDILEHIIKKVSRLLKDRKAENINAYEVIEGYELDSTKIFEADIVDEELLRIEGRYYKTSSSKKKAIHEYYKMDSRGEYSFAQQLENNDNIFLFTKLKKGGFVIDTPYGNYSPDWAIIYQVPTEQQYIGKNLKLYFITETKVDKEKSDLTGVEINKINCGKLHFKAVSDDIKFDWVNSYRDFKNKFGVKESLNN